jgi:hypothetical protein
LHKCLYYPIAAIQLFMQDFRLWCLWGKFVINHVIDGGIGGSAFIALLYPGSGVAASQLYPYCLSTQRTTNDVLAVLAARL